MQFHSEQYQPFLEGMTVFDYCKTQIEAHAQEIDQAGLQVLTDGIIAPAGIALEVLYLDLSEGDEAHYSASVSTVGNDQILSCCS
jgi:ubiquitin thioesterase protein OTUB1